MRGLERSRRLGKFPLALLGICCLLVRGASAQTAFEKVNAFWPPGFGASFMKHDMNANMSLGFDVLHYDLDVSLPMVSPGLSGSNTITVRLNSIVDTLVFHSVGLQLDSILVNAVPKPISFDSARETFTIHLGSPGLPGDTLRVRIVYQRIPEYPRPNSRQGYYYFNDSIGLPANLGYTFSEPSNARFWMPCFDEPWEKATARIIITVPSGYVPASNGKLDAVTNNGNGLTTWVWRENHPIATYLMCLTVSDFAVAALLYIRSTNDTIPIQYFTWAEDSASCAVFLPVVAEMVQEYERLFGPYPFDKYGMAAIVPFSVLGMEHQTMTTMNRFARTDERVVSHELAHQWWGDLVTCGRWTDIWLNEGFATYSEALWREHVGGFPSLRRYMVDTLQHFYFGSWLGAVYDPVGQGFNLFDDVVYSKGAWVLHTLRGVVGDSIFFRILRAYRDRHGFQSAVTFDLQAVADSVAGQDLDWFFSQWIFGPGWPKYAVSSGWSNDTLTFTISQEQSSSWPTYRMPLQVRAYSGTEDTTFLVMDSLRVQSFRVYLAFAPDSIVLDPDNRVLKQVVAPPTAVAEKSEPGETRLFQNYPNPFNPSTTIRYQLSADAFLTLKVYDVLGREVATLAEGYECAGNHAALFDAGTLGGLPSGLSSGVYVYRLQSGRHALSGTMMLLK